MSLDYFGSARWDDQIGVNFEDALDSSSVLLGRGLDYQNKAPRADWMSVAPGRHLLSVAPTRSGKGASLIIPNLLSYSGSCIVIDPKGENAWLTGKHREKMGQKVIVLDPWDEVNRRFASHYPGEEIKVSCFNPMSILDPKSPHYADDLAYLADAIIINEGKDPHWSNSARELVAGLMAYCVETDQETMGTLPTVRLLLSKPAEDIAGIAKEAQRLGFESVAARKLGRFVNHQSAELSSVISTALTQTAFLDSAALGHNLAINHFSFEDLLTGPTTIYLVLPVDKLQTYGRWLRLLVSIGIRTVARNTIALPAPVLFILDEFGTIGRLSAVAQAYGLMAGHQMCMWAFVQDLVQLKRDYPEDWETFIGNSDHVTFFNIMDQFTADYFSKMLGIETVEIISQATANQRDGGLLRASNPDYSSMNDRAHARPLMNPDELRKGWHRVLYVLGRHVPCRCYKSFYYEHDLFLTRSRPDPRFPGSLEKRREAMKSIQSKVAAEKIPDYKAALAFAQGRGIKIEESGMISKTVKGIWPDGKEQVFGSREKFIDWARGEID